MKFERLAELYSRLEVYSEKSVKTQLIAAFFREVAKENPELLKVVTLLVRGKIFPEEEDVELGLGERLVMRAIAAAAGVDVKTVEQLYKELGDLGAVAERLLSKGKIAKFFSEELTIQRVVQTLRKIAEISGPGAIDKKVQLFAGLLADASPKEAKYLVRLVLETLRIGVGEGIVRDAIAEAFRVPVDLVERAYMLTNNLGEVAYIAATQGIEGLKKIDVKPGRPIKMMLAHVAPSIEEALAEFGGAAQAEYKYDGFRVQIHCWDNQVKIFSRHLEDVTSRFPEIVEDIKRCIAAKEFIVEGEIIAVEPGTGKPRPFQYISRRIRRKYDIQKMIEEIPVRLYLFDLLYVDGQSMIDKQLKERRERLEQIFQQDKAKHTELAKKLVTGNVDEIEQFYYEAISLGHEGLMLKNLRSIYIPGKRVGMWYKLKPTLEPLDLVIIEAEWGEGKRARWLATYYVAARDEKTGRFLCVGKVGSGLTEQQLEELTRLLKELIIKEEGKKVVVRPKIVVEVDYQEIQKSPKYESGFALRFPRIRRIRYDKGPEDADTLERVRQLYELQFKKRAAEKAASQ
ncbi:MAG: ATP-dependent DNA ligase [bacterium]|nr:ATP-dependent DNA ligase [bacterium]